MQDFLPKLAAANEEMKGVPAKKESNNIEILNNRKHYIEMVIYYLAICCVYVCRIYHWASWKNLGCQLVCPAGSVKQRMALVSHPWTKTLVRHLKKALPKRTNFGKVCNLFNSYVHKIPL